MEDDYFELQKIILTKKECDGELDAKINMKSYEIGKNSCKGRAKTMMEDEKKSLSSRIRLFFKM